MTKIVYINEIELAEKKSYIGVSISFGMPDWSSGSLVGLRKLHLQSATTEMSHYYITQNTLWKCNWGYQIKWLKKETVDVPAKFHATTREAKHDDKRRREKESKEEEKVQQRRMKIEWVRK